MILATFYLQVTPILPTKFQVSWPFSSGEEKNNFQDGRHGGHLGFPIQTILTIFDLQIAPILPTKFRVSWPFGSGEEEQIRPKYGGHPGFGIGMILAVFDLQVALILQTKFLVNGPFGSGEEAQNRLSSWRPSWISNRNDFSYFWSTGHLDASYLAQGCRSRLLKQVVDAAWGSMYEGRWTLTDHNSSPWAHSAQVS